MQLSTPSLILVIIGVLVVMTIVNRVLAERRTRAMTTFAAERELTFEARDPSLVDRFHGSPFGRGYARRATNVVHGTHDGRRVVAFDYHFRVRSSSGGSGGRGSSSHTYSVIAMHLDAVVPDLSISPTGVLGHLVNAVSKRDVQVGHPDLDREFTIVTSDPQFAAELLSPEAAALMLRNSHVAWRFERDSMLMIGRGTWSTTEIDARLRLMDALLDATPAALWRRLRPE
ncbi:hypothetical protein [Nocardioides nanhaiensis]|uniref:DUF3137 domain-containing protein n=1 Tax=Nocardioides nanhaiensis TaxID=1476871 RepID=A0ABP8WJP1_9ACTN